MTNKKPSARKTIKASMHKDASLMKWSDFDHFWSTNVKNGNQSTKDACIAHLKAINAWKDQSKWVNGIIHFGIPVEK